MKLTFESATGVSVGKGPYARLRFEGECVRAEPGGAVVAEHRSHRWVVDGDDFLRLDVDVPVRVGGDGEAGAEGHFSCVDGIAYVERNVYAVADRTRGDWYVLRDERHHPVLTLEPAR